MPTKTMMQLLTETATWNGRLSTVIDLALVDLKYGMHEQARKSLQEALTEYQQYRDENIARLQEKAAANNPD